MLIKTFELNKLKKSSFNLFLLYGKNEGLQNEIIRDHFTSKFEGEIIKYEENEFISNVQIILSEMMNRSLFEEKKIIIISRASDKILRTIEEIKEKKPQDIVLILKAQSLDKKSKLRILFEKDKFLITIPFYEDDERTLSSITNNFLNKNKINLSRETVNLLTSRSNGKRENLYNELDKILNFSFSRKKILYEDVQKLSNLGENYELNKLANYYLAKNTKFVAKILNENNYSDEDCILILRTILNKSKRLLRVLEKKIERNSLNHAISDMKPPIFWKEKEIVKKQASLWNLSDLKKKIYEINDIENVVKTNSKNSINLVSDFIVNY